MFGKLLKYDFRSMFHQFAFIWPAALVLAFINRFTLNTLDNGDMASATVGVVSGVAFAGVMAAMFVTALIFVIQRFHRGLLGDEGYLMHTLPVETCQLIASKLVCSVVLTAISTIVAFLALLLLVPFSYEDLRDLFPALAKILRELNPTLLSNATAFAVELLLLLAAVCARSYLHLYLAMSIGHLAGKHRTALSVAAYIGINMAGSAAVQLLSCVDLHLNIRIEDLVGETGTIHLMLWLLIGFSLITGGIYFFCTNYILKRNLNLE